MTIVQLQYFLVLAEELHFGRASDRLGVAQSRLSSHIKKLEAECGVQLFSRSTRQVALTDPGVRFLPFARSIVGTSKSAFLAVRARDDSRSQKIHIGATAGALADGTGRKFLKTIQDQLDALVQLRTFPSEACERALSNGQVDLALLEHVKRKPAGLVVEMISLDDTCVLVKASDPMARLTKVPIHMMDQRAIIVNEDAAIESSVARIQRHFSEFDVSFPTVHSVGDWMSVIELVRGGFGFAFVPGSLDLSMSNDLVKLPLDPMGPRVPRYVAWREGEARSEVLAAISAFQDIECT